MTNQEFYNLLDQAGHRLGNLAKNNPAYEFELHKLIEIVEGKYKHFGYFWTDTDLDYPDRQCSGVYFGDPKDVLDGDDMIQVFIKEIK